MKRREPLTNTQLLMFIAIGIFVVMYGVAMIILSGAFLKWKNLVDLLNDNAYLIIISCALTVVMIGGGINISVGGVIGLTVMSCVLFLNGPMSQLGGVGVLLTFLLALGIGLAFGAGQGFLVSYLEIQPFIVTLAGMFLSRGLTTILSDEPLKVTKETNAAFIAFQKTKIKLPVGHMTVDGSKWLPEELELGALVAILMVIGMFLLLRYMKLGRNIYALV